MKGHVVEENIPEFVDLFGTCGILGEDGVEGLHPQDTLVRRIVRSVRNPEARHKAHTRHLQALVFCTGRTKREVKERISQKQRVACRCRYRSEFIKTCIHFFLFIFFLFFFFLRCVFFLSFFRFLFF